MTQLSDLTGTAFIVAEFRARENDEPSPLYRDTVVPLFLSEETKEAATRIAGDTPAEEGVKLRTRYLDDSLDEYLSRGWRQVVILGAGLDTRAVRKDLPGVTYFEIDDASILNFKRDRLEQAGIDAPIVFVPGDYVAEDLLALLQVKGFDRAAPAYFIWEGNTMYLSRPAVLKVLTALRDGLDEFAISFDFVSEAVIDKTAGDSLSLLVERFADMGAVFTFGIDDLHQLAREAGLEVADDVRVSNLHRKFWPNRETYWEWYDNYTLCTLTR